MWGMSQELTDEDWQRLARVLRHRLETTPRTKAEVLRDAGLSQGTLDDYLSGRGRTKHRPDKLRDLVLALGYTADSGERVLRGEEPVLSPSRPTNHTGSEGWPAWLEDWLRGELGTLHESLTRVVERLEDVERRLSEAES